jgi:hypothetical protein
VPDFSETTQQKVTGFLPAERQELVCLESSKFAVSEAGFVETARESLSRSNDFGADFRSRFGLSISKLAIETVAMCRDLGCG